MLISFIEFLNYGEKCKLLRSIQVSAVIERI